MNARQILFPLIMILIGFTVARFSTTYQSNEQLKEYQIRIEPDSAYIYDNGRLVGSCKQGLDGIDSVILKDNL